MCLLSILPAAALNPPPPPPCSSLPAAPIPVGRPTAHAAHAAAARLQCAAGGAGGGGGGAAGQGAQGKPKAASLKNVWRGALFKSQQFGHVSLIVLWCRAPGCPGCRSARPAGTSSCTRPPRRWRGCPPLSWRCSCSLHAPTARRVRCPCRCPAWDLCLLLAASVRGDGVAHGARDAIVRMPGV